MKIKHSSVSRGWDNQDNSYYFRLEIEEVPLHAHVLDRFILDMVTSICDRIPDCRWLAKYIPFKGDDGWTTVDEYYGGFKGLYCCEIGCNGPLQKWVWNYSHKRTQSTSIRLSMDQVTEIAKTNIWVQNLLETLEEDTKYMIEGDKDEAD